MLQESNSQKTKVCPTCCGSWEHPMFMDAVILIGLGFAVGYGVRAWISARRRRAIRKARGD